MARKSEWITSHLVLGDVNTARECPLAFHTDGKLVPPLIAPHLNQAEGLLTTQFAAVLSRNTWSLYLLCQQKTHDMQTIRLSEQVRPSQSTSPDGLHDMGTGSPCGCQFMSRKKRRQRERRQLRCEALRWTLSQTGSSEVLGLSQVERNASVAWPTSVDIKAFFNKSTAQCQMRKNVTHIPRPKCPTTTRPCQPTPLSWRRC
jgi:hypothetical protein